MFYGYTNKKTDKRKVAWPEKQDQNTERCAKIRRNSKNAL